MNDDISDKTKDIIWKYLQLILFSTISEISNKNSFGETGEMFNNIGEDFIISIGDNKTRKLVVDRSSFDYGIAVHTNSIIDNTSKIIHIYFKLTSVYLQFCKSI